MVCRRQCDRGIQFRVQNQKYKPKTAVQRRRAVHGSGKLTEQGQVTGKEHRSSKSVQVTVVLSQSKVPGEYVQVSSDRRVRECKGQCVSNRRVSTRVTVGSECKW